MLTKFIKLKSFKQKTSKKIVSKNLKLIIKNKTEMIKSLGKNYINNYKIRKIKSLVGKDDVRLIGMGGSILGPQAIYSFLEKKTKKKFTFIDNLNLKPKKIKRKFTNIIISKSGNTLETISNVNIFVKNFEKKIFITEKKPSYLRELAYKLRSEIVDHNNFIGGRYSVLSEVGMLPAELMGFDPKQFRQFNNLVKNKKFLNLLIQNSSSILHFVKKKKFNSIILNYDQKSKYLFLWYQQLVAESLGKKGKGILPVISDMPKDNHSVMQLYIDGFKNNFFTFFYCKESQTDRISNNNLLKNYKFLKNHCVDDIIFKQKIATEKVFDKQNIPYRSFEIRTRNEKSLGELFCYFILETILLGKSLNVNPFDQPSVELIKTETRKLF
tara:strand:- start:330 stop:1478 length:1149 start_codon:yes stop_codon:yes gene_type:complete